MITRRQLFAAPALVLLPSILPDLPPEVWSRRLYVDKWDYDTAKLPKGWDFHGYGTALSGRQYDLIVMRALASESPGLHRILYSWVHCTLRTRLSPGGELVIV